MKNHVNDMGYLVKAVVAEDNYMLFVDFVDGKRKRFDMKPIIAHGGVSERLKDVEFFKKAHVDRDTVAWDDVIDIAPESLYERGISIS